MEARKEGREGRKGRNERRNKGRNDGVCMPAVVCYCKTKQANVGLLGLFVFKFYLVHNIDLK